MKDYRTDERRLNDYYHNCLSQFVGKDTPSIHSFFEILRFKAEVRTFSFTPASRKLFRFFLLLSLDTGTKVPVSVKRFLDAEERKLVSIGPASLSIKDKEEADKEIISLFTSKEVKDEMKKVIDTLWDGHIDGNESEKEHLDEMYKDFCVFGQNVAWMIK